MRDLAVLAPLVLLLLMLLLGRFERWLQASEAPLPARPERRRWHSRPRPVRTTGGGAPAAGRRARPRAGTTARGHAAAPRGSVLVPRAGRRRLLGDRFRSRH